MEIGFVCTDSGFQGVVKSLDSDFAKADALLQMVHDKLANEFQTTYPGNANPLKLRARTKRLQDELPLLREECDKLLAAKQDLIDRARTTLVKNRTLLCQLRARADLPVSSDVDDPIYSGFVKTLEEWDQQMKMVKPAGNQPVYAVTDSDQSERPELNLELFRSNWRITDCSAFLINGLIRKDDPTCWRFCGDQKGGQTSTIGIIVLFLPACTHMFYASVNESSIG